MEVNVLHKYGANRHYLALEYLSSVDDLEYREFLPANGGLKYISDFSWISKSLATGSKNIIGAFEPFSPAVYLFDSLKSRNNVIYHTSWPFWTDDRVPVCMKNSVIRQKWISFLQSTTVVTVTKAAARSLENLNVDAKVIPHSVDIATYYPREKKLGEDSLTALFVGRLEERKGVKQILSCVSQTDDIEYVFVGSGPFEDHIEELASTKGNVTYHGYVTDEERLASIYRDSDVLLLPSQRAETWEELFGIVIIEAMASGIPVIASDCVGPEEIIQPGKTGDLISKKSQDELLWYLRKYRDNPQRRIELGEKARKAAVENYSLEVVGRQWEQILKNEYR
ncbi:glycosyltransferase family 4 protein [Haloarcula marismortui]|uniref:glycosyltransferase family 4 protein n=1 Tax=Haloarcula marismortui TaxID=2238 RepID=UPI003C71DFDB